ncbi:hypothetical protein NIES4071_56400 [Calothrix sp. NIES-4071]|nr:hypothetical protein NIES4071_56400 [Calothrix sp. NIES-4071]BAZ59947.1 hypothetical protein NIES4105_56350 [Calothrix sp. NIES-4105]
MRGFHSPYSFWKFYLNPYSCLVRTQAGLVDLELEPKLLNKKDIAKCLKALEG